ncbi:MAG: chemotaxis protein CheW [Acidobacteria bacterium]|nr:chemotaxis protein CheW [Acidobacteriota bacterium]
MESEIHRLVVFLLDAQRYALRLSAVERIVRAVEVTPLPKAPEIVLGVVNYHGRVLPVVDVRRRFRLPPRELRLSDHLVLAHTPRRTVGLLANTVTDVVELMDREIIAAEKILPALEHIEGVARLPDGMIFIHDLDTFLSLDEEKTLDAALEKT